MWNGQYSNRRGHLKECSRPSRLVILIFPVYDSGCAFHSANSLCPSSLSKNACISGSRTRSLRVCFDGGRARIEEKGADA